MNIPKGYKLVPVELLERISAYAPEGFCAPTALQGFAIEAGWVLAAPNPPQPICDEANERELFEAHCAKVGLPTDTLPSGEYLIPATRFMSQGWHARAKAGEDE